MSLKLLLIVILILINTSQICYLTNTDSNLSDLVNNEEKYEEQVMSDYQIYFPYQHRFIHGGQRAGENEYPFMVSLLIADGPDNLGYICCGSIISHNQVISAAHCVSGGIHKIGRYRIMPNYRNRAYPEQGDKVYHIKSLSFPIRAHRHIHFEHDIVIITLTESIRFIEGKIESIKIDENRLSINDVVEVAGWGFAPWGRPMFLQRARLSILPSSKCQPIYTMFKDDKSICAGSDEADSCAGDSGGPLITLNDQGQIHLVGIVSMGKKECGSAPAVYTNIEYYFGWIQTINQTVDLGSDMQNNEIPKSIEVSTRMHRGNRAEIGDVPYIVSILVYDHDNYFFHCTGTIISKIYVLTTSFCVSRLEPGQTFIYPNLRLQKFPESEFKDLYAVELIITHENFTESKPTHNDIALIKLSQPFKFNQIINSIDLPISKLTGKQVMHSGYGLGTGDPQYLKIITVSMKSDVDCKQVYAEHYYPENICAGDRYEGFSCGGDLGEPIVYFDDDDKPKLVGLKTSTHQFDCNKFTRMPRMYEIYTSIYEYLNWIISHVKDDNNVD